MSRNYAADMRRHIGFAEGKPVHRKVTLSLKQAKAVATRLEDAEALLTKARDCYFLERSEGLLEIMRRADRFLRDDAASAPETLKALGDDNA